MRTIKYQAWDKENEKMLFDVGVMGTAGVIAAFVQDFRGAGILVNPISERFVLREYTGLKDKKRTKKYPEGQEIYEGDIVKVGKTCSFVVYLETGAGFRFNSYMECGIDHLYDASQQGEVIGNRFENPELLAP